MELTREEQSILEGAQGEAAKFAMEILVKIGEGVNAERLIPISSVHLVLHAYKSAFDAGVEAAEKIADLGAKFIVPTTIDPYGMDAEDWQGAKTPESYAVMQQRLENAMMRMRVTEQGLFLTEIHENYTLAQVQEATEAILRVDEHLKVMQS
jgi:predicted aconitase